MNIDFKISAMNLLKWSNMEDWEDGTSLAPTEHTLSGASAAVARESTIIKQGTYSAKVTRSGANVKLYYDLPDYLDYRNRKVTLGFWVYATVASRGRISIDDGVSAASNSSYHTGGSAWQRLTVTHDINPSASQLRLSCEVNTGNTAVYFDGGFLGEGDSDILILSDVGTISDIQPANKYKIQQSRISRRDGIRTPNARLDSKSLSIKGMIAESTATGTRTNLDLLNRIINSSRLTPDRDREMRDIFLNDDRFLRGHVSDFNYKHKSAMRINEFKMKFLVPDPYFQYVQMLRKAQALSGTTSFTVSVNGNASSRPIIRITNDTTTISSIIFENLTTDQVFSYAGDLVTGNTLVIDTDKLTVLNNSVSDIGNFTGDFSTILVPGDNAIKVQGVVSGTAKIDWYDRWF